MKPSPPSFFERVVFIGGPLLFLTLLYFGYQTLIGPSPRPNPIEVLKKGSVSVGNSIDVAQERLGPPNSISTAESGNEIYRYERTKWSAEMKTIIAEDAYVEVNSQREIVSINFDSREPPVNPGAK